MHQADSSTVNSRFRNGTIWRQQFGAGDLAHGIRLTGTTSLFARSSLQLRYKL